MRAANSAGKQTRWRQTLRRMLEQAVRCGSCSCGGLPTKHAQRVRFDFFFVLDDREPVGFFVQRPVAFRALPNDLQASVIDGEPCAQTVGAGKSDIAVRGVAFRAGNASGAASNGPAKPVPVWPVCGLMAAAAMGAHAAACSRDARSTAQSTSGRISSQRTAPFVARSIDGQRSAGTGRMPLHHWLISTGVMPSLLARSDAGPFVEMYVRRSIAHTLAQR